MPPNWENFNTNGLTTKGRFARRWSVWEAQCLGFTELEIPLPWPVIVADSQAAHSQGLPLSATSPPLANPQIATRDTRWNRLRPSDTVTPGVVTSRLPSAGVPDRSGRFVVSAFTPHGMSRTIAVDRQAEVVSEREAESARKNVVVPADRSRELRLPTPTRAAVRRGTIKRVPQPMIRTPRFVRTRVHPRDTHIA